MKNGTINQENFCIKNMLFNFLNHFSLIIDKASTLFVPFKYYIRLLAYNEYPKLYR